MRVRAAKAITKGQKITKVVTWDSMGQVWNENGRTEFLRSASILVAETGRYHEDGDTNEEGWTLSQVLNTDAVLEIWTAEGKVWETQMTSVEELTGK